jgi:hypothetical protein
MRLVLASRDDRGSGLARARARSGGADHRYTAVDRRSIVATVGSKDDARTVFSTIFAVLFSHSRQELFPSSQIRPDWLPTVRGANLTLVNDAEANALIPACESYWIVRRVVHTKDRVTGQLEQIEVDLALKCGCSALSYGAYFDGRE